MSLIGLLYMFMGLMVGAIGAADSKNGPPAGFGWMFGLIGFGIFAGCIIFGLLQWRAAQCLEQRHSKMFCTVIAAINCMHVPWGTILSIFTFMVLSRETVAQVFEDRDQKQLATGPQQAA